MAHYARINDQNMVTEVIVATEEAINSGDFGDPSQWLQTSYNTRSGVHVQGGRPYRGNYAAPGFLYDSQLDAFIPPRPEDGTTWILDTETYSWVRPVPQPTPAPYKFIHWLESTQSWVQSNNPFSPEDTEL